MNPYVILLLGGQVSANVVFYGGYASVQAALSSIIGTGKPWAYQLLQVYGPVVNNPPGPLMPVTVSPGAWLAVASGFDPSGNPALYGYGTFSSSDAANAWTAQAGVPGAYSIGQVSAPI